MTPVMELAILLIVIAWLTAAAMAVRSVSRIWLRHWVEQRLNGAVTASAYLARPQRLVLVAGAGVALSVLAVGMLLGTAYDGAAWTLVARVIGAALVILVVGQLVPRAIARRWGQRLVPLLLPVLRALDVVLTPVLLLSRGVARMAGVPRQAEGAEAGREGIEELLREGALEGVGEREEIAIISGVVQFGEKTLGEVMTPRADLFALDVTGPPDEVARQIALSGYSRVPIYRDSMDNIIGMLHAFDVLKATRGQAPALRPVESAEVTTRCNDLLFAMLRARRHLTVVKDAAGRTVGLVSLEDLLEELVGDIRDEHDEPQPPRPVPVDVIPAPSSVQ